MAAVGYTAVTFILLMHTGSQANELGTHNDDMEKVVSGEKSLMRNLLDDYDVRVRPVINSSHPVVIYHGIVPIQITDIDEVKQLLILNVWLRHEWFDPQLKWNPSDYNGLTELSIPEESIWLPDIVLYNRTVNNGNKQEYVLPKAAVRYDGKVFWVPMGICHVYCKINVKYFPFDVQQCSLSFSSEMHDSTQMVIKPYSPAINLANYLVNGEWNLTNVTAERTIREYQKDVRYTFMIYTFTLRRRVVYYMINIVFPCLWLSVLSIMTFWLPPNSGEKITLGITVLLAFSVFMLLVAESMPKTSESVPLIGIYLCVTMSLTSMATIQTIIVKKLCYVGPQVQRMSPWLRNFTFNYLAWVLCMKRCSVRCKTSSSEDGGMKDEEIVSAEKKEDNKIMSSEVPEQLLTVDVGMTSVNSHLDWLLECLIEYRTNRFRQPVYLSIQDEWESLALMLDKLSFVLYTTITVLASVGLLVLMPLTGNWHNV